MDKEQLYQWRETIREYLPLGAWQGLILAAFSLGVMATRRCPLNIVAEGLGVLGKVDSVERRLQRWLDNERLERESCQRAWAKWVLSKVDVSEGITLLVDETSLSDHLSLMRVGLAYEGRCVPLAWRCYPPAEWPAGQVLLISHLLERVKAALPVGTAVLVQADRGLGTSPDLGRAVLSLDWPSWFRVQGITHFQSSQQADSQLRHLVERGGQPYCASGQIFKDAGWLDCHVRLIWDKAYPEPWCLISDLPDLTGREYGKRNWQEHGFRDLKSGGWHWPNSQVGLADHAERLRLVLALAYALTLSFGLRLRSQPELRAQVLRGQRQRFSWFRLGLRLLAALKRLGEPILFYLDFRPPLSSQLLACWLT